MKPVIPIGGVSAAGILSMPVMPFAPHAPHVSSGSIYVHVRPPVPARIVEYPFPAGVRLFKGPADAYRGAARGPAASFSSAAENETAAPAGCGSVGEPPPDVERVSHKGFLLWPKDVDGLIRSATRDGVLLFIDKFGRQYPSFTRNVFAKRLKLVSTPRMKDQDELASCKSSLNISIGNWIAGMTLVLEAANETAARLGVDSDAAVALRAMVEGVTHEPFFSPQTHSKGRCRTKLSCYGGKTPEDQAVLALANAILLGRNAPMSTPESRAMLALCKRADVTKRIGRRLAESMRAAQTASREYDPGLSPDGRARLEALLAANETNANEIIHLLRAYLDKSETATGGALWLEALSKLFALSKDDGMHSDWHYNALLRNFQQQPEAIFAAAQTIDSPPAGLPPPATIFEVIQYMGASGIPLLERTKPRPSSIPWDTLHNSLTPLFGAEVSRQFAAWAHPRQLEPASYYKQSQSGRRYFPSKDLVTRFFRIFYPDNFPAILEFDEPTLAFLSFAVALNYRSLSGPEARKFLVRLEPASIRDGIFEGAQFAVHGDRVSVDRYLSSSNVASNIWTIYDYCERHPDRFEAGQLLDARLLMAMANAEKEAERQALIRASQDRTRAALKDASHRVDAAIPSRRHRPAQAAVSLTPAEAILQKRIDGDPICGEVSELSANWAALKPQTRWNVRVIIARHLTDGTIDELKEYLRRLNVPEDALNDLIKRLSATKL